MAPFICQDLILDAQIIIRGSASAKQVEKKKQKKTKKNNTQEPANFIYSTFLLDFRSLFAAWLGIFLSDKTKLEKKMEPKKKKKEKRKKEKLAIDGTNNFP